MADEGALVCVLKPAECRPGVLEQPWQAPYPITTSSATRDQESQRWLPQTPTPFSEENVRGLTGYGGQTSLAESIEGPRSFRLAGRGRGGSMLRFALR